LDTIEAQNEKLREISWIQSHLVRGPLARIMGLIQLIDDSKDDDEFGTILQYIALSATELDNAIKQISDKSIPVSI
jgi:signal transduction histidine kinase